MIILILIGLVVLIGVIYLIVIGLAGLITAIREISKGGKAGWEEGKRRREWQKRQAVHEKKSKKQKGDL